MQTFKCILVGEENSGKSSLISLFTKGNIPQKYKPTIGVEVHPVIFDTSLGKIQLNIWDCAGQDKFGGLRDGYYIQADCAIIMYSTKESTVQKYAQDIYRVCGNIPYVIVKNKIDINPSDAKYINISTLQDSGCKPMFQELLRLVTQNQNLVIL